MASCNTGRVLVVEEERDEALRLRARFIKLGHPTMVAFERPAALQLVRRAIRSKHRIGAVLLNCEALGLIKLMEEIWKLDPHVQIIIRNWDDSVLDAHPRLAESQAWHPLPRSAGGGAIRQCLAIALRKWKLEHDSKQRMDDLSRMLDLRIKEMIRTRDELLAVNKQLVHAKRSAEQASQAKSLFLANMSHEIRTPMTAILGYAEVLRDSLQQTASRPEDLAAVHTISRNGEHLLQLINNVLDLSKIEAGKLDVEKLEFSPIRLLDEIVDIFRGRAEEKCLALSATIADNLPLWIESDPTRLKQILINLVSNAVKFTEKGAVHISAGWLDGKPETGKLQLEVCDTGIGISSEHLVGLFEPFRQADNTMSRRYGGTGLGLSICHRFAQLLGGCVAVRSEPGVGSVFTVVVDAEAARRPDGVPREAAASNASERAISLTTPTTADLQGRRILLAEDGPDNQRLLLHFLRKAGAEVTIAENGQEACHMFADAEANGRPYDLVVMDMQMPVMDGYTATRQLRMLGAKLPIIALTAHAMTGDDIKCLDAGCDACLTKPIKRYELLAGLVKHLQRTSLAADLVSKAEANKGLRHLSDAETETQRVKQLVALPL